MTVLQRHLDAQGRVRWLPIPHLSASEINRELELEWARQRAEAKARAQAELNAQDVRLEIAAVELYGQLGKAIGGITTQQSWCDLDDEITMLVETKRLSSRHGTELHERLIRVARDRRWLHA